MIIKIAPSVNKECILIQILYINMAYGKGDKHNV